MNLSTGNVTVSDQYKATYVASWAAYTPPNQYIFSFSGVATKVIKILRIGINATQTTQGVIDVKLYTAAGLFAGVGTPVSPTGIVAFDSQSPAAAGTPFVYTTSAAPSGTTLVVKSVNLTVPAPATTGAGQNEYVFDFTNDFSQALTLKDAGTVALIQFITAPTGLSVAFWVEWTEE